MRKMALLEKTKTPYRPPLFEYLGKYVDLTVYYVGNTPVHRRWDVSSDPKNYKEKMFDAKKIGPATVVSELRNDLILENYDEIVASSAMQMLLNSFLATSAAKSIDAHITIWSEKISTPWVKGQNRPIDIKLLKKFSRPTFKAALQKLYSVSDSIVAYSSLAGQAANVVSGSNSTITIAPQWYPPDLLPSPISQLTESDKYRVLFVGELCKRKGVDILVDVAKKYNKDDGIEFVIAGDGELRNIVNIANNRYSHITALGYIDEKRKVSEYAAADLFVLPSRHDPWGLVINEAYLFDTPVITTHTTGAEMIVPNNQTVSPADSDDLYRGIEYARDTSLNVPNQPSVAQMAKPLITPVKNRSKLVTDQ